jgi:hypothetical protein
MQNIDVNIWYPHYWYFLNMAALNYPDHPTTIDKKIYYRFIHNFYYFIPNPELSKLFRHFVDIYPLTPYLDNKLTVMKWTHFITSKINDHLHLPSPKFESMMYSLLKKNTFPYKYIIYIIILIVFIFIVYKTCI